MRPEKIGIVGSGLIGRAWSMLFASVGYQVMLYDILPSQIEAALGEIKRELEQFEAQGILRGTLNASEQFECISSTNEIAELVRNAVFIQECIPERLVWKCELYQQLDTVVEAQTIISSSTSTFMPSLFSKNLNHRENVLVSHPLNPPYFLPLVEIVPAPWTKREVVAKARALMLEIGQKPVTLSREVQGFATNRIQYAILNEVWHLFEDGILSVADVDSVMTNGLGLRYALLGPLETAHLNADGIADYFGRFGQEIYAVSATYGPTPEIKPGKTLTRIAEQCEQLVPRNQLADRRSVRDKFLTALCGLKRDF